MSKPDLVRAVLVEGKPYRRMPDGSLRPLKGRTDWSRADRLSDAELTEAAEADGDARPMSDEEWAQADIEKPVKVAVGLRLDRDVIAWFKRGGRGYQTRINTVLRRYIAAKRASSSLTAS